VRVVVNGEQNDWRFGAPLQAAEEGKETGERLSVLKGPAHEHRRRRISRRNLEGFVDVGDRPEVHEEEAAHRLATATAGANTGFTGPREGRINIKAKVSGLLKVNRTLLNAINSIEGITVSTRHSNVPVNEGEVVAGVKIIPLYIEAAILEQVEDLAAACGTVVEIKPYVVKNAGVVVTGNEVYKGLIKDKFLDIMKNKLEALGASVASSTIVPDDEDRIAAAVREMHDRNLDLIIVCGGLSVDPDDVTVEGVARSGARIVKYGSPIMPGAMVLVAVLEETPILGAPAGGLFHTTAIDVLLPRLMAGEKINREDIVAAGYGGLCLNCRECLFPVCPFGK